MANSVRLRALTRAERRVLQAKVKDRRLTVRLHRRYRLIAEVARGRSVAEVADRVGCNVTVRKRNPRRFTVSIDPTVEAMWRAVITGENPIWRSGWRLRRMIPGRQRCKNCNAPFTGIGGAVMRLVGRGQYNRNPRFCDF